MAELPLAIDCNSNRQGVYFSKKARCRAVHGNEACRNPLWGCSSYFDTVFLNMRSIFSLMTPMPRWLLFAIALAWSAVL